MRTILKPAALGKLVLQTALIVLCYSCSTDDSGVENEKKLTEKEAPVVDGEENDKDPIGSDRDSYGFTRYFMRHRLTDSIIPYSYFEPVEPQGSIEKLPLILALHGAEYFLSEKEMFLKGQERAAYMALAWLEKENQQKYPAYVVAPHLHDGLSNLDNESYFGWQKRNSSDFVAQLLDSLLANNDRIDKERVYLTGHSMGGSGTWYLGVKLRDKIAAIVPLSSAFDGASETFKVVETHITNNDFKEIPTWSFIHRADANSKSKGDGSRVAFELLRENGYGPVYTHRKGDIDNYLTREEIFAEIRANKKHFHTEYNYPCGSVGDCHFAQEVALREDFLLEWLFRQVKM